MRLHWCVLICRGYSNGARVCVTAGGKGGRRLGRRLAAAVLLPQSVLPGPTRFTCKTPLFESHVHTTAQPET